MIGKPHPPEKTVLSCINRAISGSCAVVFNHMPLDLSSHATRALRAEREKNKSNSKFDFKSQLVWIKHNICYRNYNSCYQQYLTCYVTMCLWFKSVSNFNKAVGHPHCLIQTKQQLSDSHWLTESPFKLSSKKVSYTSLEQKNKAGHRGCVAFCKVNAIY